MEPERALVVEVVLGALVLLGVAALEMEMPQPPIQVVEAVVLWIRRMQTEQAELVDLATALCSG